MSRGEVKYEPLNIAKDWLNLVDRGKKIMEAIQFPSAIDRITCLFDTCPETKDFKHETIACLLGLARETVSRTLNSLGIFRRV